jgi:2,4-dienoyl-CoA reductase-like NADH-dependent reductase (Old Yellow Enzyme family)
VGVLSTYRYLERPIRINKCELRNRIVRTAHTTGFANGSFGDQLIDYHVARARGGVALSILEIGAVHPSSVAGIRCYDDGIVDAWGRLAERVHSEGMRVFQQLFHGGSNVGPADGGSNLLIDGNPSPSWAPSAIRDPLYGNVPIAMSTGQIDDVVHSFGDAAARCAEAGLDGVEVHAAHGYLVGQFLSPLTNARTDDYGGSPTRRMLFLERVLREVRERGGPDLAVSVRLSGSESTPGGIEPGEAAETRKAIERAGFADLVNVSQGAYTNIHRMIPTMQEAPGYQLAASGIVTSGARLPTVVVGRFTSLAEAEEVVASGVSDLVGMVRATIADPAIVAKSLGGHAAAVRPCLGCNDGCIGGRHNIGKLQCVVNVDVGFEGVSAADVPAATRRVTVVGGGPAGLQAACTAAERGHQVTLFERSEVLGGTLRFARRAPYRDRLGAITDWLEARMAELGVSIVLGSEMTAEDVHATGAQSVVVATGAEADLEGRQRYRPATEIRRAAHAQVVSGVDILSGAVSVAGRRAFVFDDVGYYAALGVVEAMLCDGALEVILATGDPMVGQALVRTNQRDPVAGRLRAYTNFASIERTSIEYIGEHHVVIRDLDNSQQRTLSADMAVLFTDDKPRRDVFDELNTRWPELDTQIVGDASGAHARNYPNYLQHAISTGHRAGLQVGRARPASLAVG